jgi:hypothetical protein
MAGLAMGSKYLALASLPILLAAVAFDPRAGSGLGRCRPALWLGGVALIVACPWYIKNLVWGGNPFYPFLLGGTEWPAERLELLMSYLRSFGSPRSLLGILFLPLLLLTQPDIFGTFIGGIDIPSPLFLVAFATPLLKRDHPFRPLGWMTLLRFALWALGTQQTRFLLPLYPVLALLTAAVLDTWISRVGAARWRLLAVTGIVAGLVAVTFAYQLVFLTSIRPLPVVLGAESKSQFLERSVYDYPALRFISANLPPQARVFMAWDGQGFYCDERCQPDAEQSQWAQLVGQARTEEAVAEWLRHGFDYLLVDLDACRSCSITTRPRSRRSLLLPHGITSHCLDRCSRLSRYRLPQDLRMSMAPPTKTKPGMAATASVSPILFSCASPDRRGARHQHRDDSSCRPFALRRRSVTARCLSSGCASICAIGERRPWHPPWRSSQPEIRRPLPLFPTARASHAALKPPPDFGLPW